MFKFNCDETGVYVNIFEEQMADWSFVEPTDLEIIGQIERGELVQVVIKVMVYDRSGEIEGFDILGGVCLDLHEDNEFVIRQTIDSHNMVDIAKQDLANKLSKIRSLNQTE
jgi:hypothetical protein